MAVCCAWWLANTVGGLACELTGDISVTCGLERLTLLTVTGDNWLWLWVAEVGIWVVSIESRIWLLATSDCCGCAKTNGFWKLLIWAWDWELCILPSDVSPLCTDSVLTGCGICMNALLTGGGCCVVVVGKALLVSLCRYPLSDDVRIWARSLSAASGDWALLERLRLWAGYGGGGQLTLPECWMWIWSVRPETIAINTHWHHGLNAVLISIIMMNMKRESIILYRLPTYGFT